MKAHIEITESDLKNLILRHLEERGALPAVDSLLLVPEIKFEATSDAVRKADTSWQPFSHVRVTIKADLTKSR